MVATWLGWVTQTGLQGSLSQKRGGDEERDVPQHARGLPTLAEDLGSIPGIHRLLTTTCTSKYRGVDVLSGLCGQSMFMAHAHTQIVLGEWLAQKTLGFCFLICLVLRQFP